MRSFVSVVVFLTAATGALASTACGFDSEDFSRAETSGVAGTSAGGAGSARPDAGAATGGTQATVGGAGGSGAPAGLGSAGAGGAPSQSLGAACAAAADCASGFCVDGVCCDSACDGTCETCAAAGSEGTCSPVAQYTDPEGECGPGTCALGVETINYCDGAGACKHQSFPCATYKCGATACTTSCTTSADCSSTGWCNQGKCSSKSLIGYPCKTDDACVNGLCEQGVCCKTECSPPFSCDSGVCACGTQVCAAGDQCVTWYKDEDFDGFGNPKQKKLGCSSNLEFGWVTNGDDCYDQNANARPGQKMAMPSDRGDGSFDFDCDGVETKAYPVVVDPNQCKVCGACAGPCDGKVGFGCSAVPYCPAANKGFTVPVACGAKGTLHKCQGSDWSGTCTPTLSTTSMVTQACR